MKKILIIGNFENRTNIIGGQTARTRTVANSIKESDKNLNVICIDTSYKSVHVLLKTILAARSSFRIIFITGEKGLYPILSLLHYTKSLEKTAYVVIGGWLADYIKNSRNKNLIMRLQRLKAIHVQTRSLKVKLNSIGLTNVHFFPNYRAASDELLSHKETDGNLERVVYYSRVCKDKGIEMAIEAIDKINALIDKPIFLDVYGPIHDNYINEFMNLLNKSSFVSYKGVLKSEEIIPTLREYNCMLFPTHYEGEGFPGSVLESLMAGVPIIASDWKYNREIICDHETGLIFDTFSIEDLIEKITYLRKRPELVKAMSKKCILDANQYHESKVVPILLESMDLIPKED